MKTFGSYINAHQNVTSAEENFKNQVDSMACFVDISQYLSPPTSVIAQWAREQVTMVAGNVCYSWAQKHRLLVTNVKHPISVLQHCVPDMA